MNFNFKGKQPANFSFFDSDNFPMIYVTWPGKWNLKALAKCIQHKSIMIFIIIILFVVEASKYVREYVYGWPLHDYYLTEIYISVIYRSMLIQCNMERSSLVLMLNVRCEPGLK